MELRDLIVTPILLIVIYFIAYRVRPYATDEVTKKYFIPGLTVRIIGALAVGFIYQFYYSGGDTFAYHTYGSRYIWNAFMDDPINGFDLLFSNGKYNSESFKYASQIWYYRDQASFFVIRVCSVFDLLTFSSYSGTAVLFSVIGFLGAWLLFQAFYKIYPGLHKWIAISCLFIPTVFFWGSGIFKDTLTLAALGIATFYIFKMIASSHYSWRYLLMILICFWVIYSIKIYILLCFLPAVILWVFIKKMVNVRNMMGKILLIPFMLLMVAVMGYYAIVKVGEDDPRYNVNKIAETAMITAYDIRYGWGARTGETSGYDLGELDGSFGSMIRLAPQAINVSLFRPYLWEVKNPLMLLSALESLAFVWITLYVLYKARGKIISTLKNPEVAFCLIFSIVFAFSVGISTYNFGTLSRYKIPLIPFYLIGLGLIYYLNNERKFSELEDTE